MSILVMNRDGLDEPFTAQVSTMERYTSRPERYFVKENVDEHENYMHGYIYELKIEGLNIPRPVMYNEATRQFVMEKIEGMSVSDMFGENIEDVPDEVFQQIREIMVKLVDNEIEYPDFTGYNFVLDKNVSDKIWLVDFEHSTCSDCTSNEFIMGVYNGAKTWNSEYM